MENDELQLSQHISKQFNQELEDVRNQVLKMGGLVERQVQDGLNSLLNGDVKLAKKVIKRDRKVNAMEVGIDESCVEILARRQPAASDLRLVISIIKTITDLERIGDEAEKLANSTKMIDEDKITDRQFHELRSLGESVIRMLKRTLDATARMDVEEALDIIKSDVEINQEFESLSRLLVLKMMEDPRCIKDALSISWSARALERIGDHAKNICEYVVYLVKGKDVRHISMEDLDDTLDDL